MSESDQMDQGEEGELPVEFAESGESAAVHLGGCKPEKTLLPLPAPAFSGSASPTPVHTAADVILMEPSSP